MIAIFQRPVRLVLLLLALTASTSMHAQDPKDSQSSFNWTGLYLGANAGYGFPHYDMRSYDDTVTFRRSRDPRLIFRSRALANHGTASLAEARLDIIIS
jgi:hypothetical protein